MLHSFLPKASLLMISTEHVIVFGLIALLLFGGKKIPELMRGLGHGIREFNDAKQNVKKEIEDGIHKENTSNASNTTPPVVTEAPKNV
jgi:sec-independent protein translocase protein TatA